MNPDTTTRNRFDAIFAQVAKSSTLASIWSEVYAQDYPQDASPFSFVTVPELRWLASELHVCNESMFVDLACGRGGPSLFVARETGAAVTGIDSSWVAIKAARAAAMRACIGRRTAFIVADATMTGLRAESVEAVMSVDAMQLMPDQGAVIAEVARLLKPAGRFAFTTWVSRRADSGLPFAVDYRPLFKSAGLVLESCHEPSGWEARELAVFAQILEHVAVLGTELSEPVAMMLAAEAARIPKAYPLIRRVNVVARKTDEGVAAAGRRFRS